MSSYNIALTFHGPFFSVEEFKYEIADAQHNYDEKRILYMATKRSDKTGEDKFRYIGITQQAEMQNRFNSNHKILKNLRKWDRLWVGYFSEDNIGTKRIGIHEERLRVAEDILINWFLPDLNDQGISKDGGKRIGNGSYCYGSVELKWRTKANQARVYPAINKIPKKIVYSANRDPKGKYDFLWGYY